MKLSEGLPLLPLCWSCQEDAQEEFGWKLVHGDVFRPPRKGMLLSVFLGSGTQIFIMMFVTLCEFYNLQLCVSVYLLLTCRNAKQTFYTCPDHLFVITQKQISMVAYSIEEVLSYFYSEIRTSVSLI